MKYELTDEEMLVQCIDFVKNNHPLPQEFTERLKQLGMLDIFTEDLCIDIY